MDFRTAETCTDIENLNVHTNLLSLDDDCLRALLRLLPIDDLTAMASTCMRLHAIACGVFNRLPASQRRLDLSQISYKLKNQLNDFPQMQSKLVGSEYTKMLATNIKRLIRCFGHILHEVDFTVKVFADFPYEQIFECVVSCCGDGKLEKLRFVEYPLPLNLIVRGARLFHQLKSLHLTGYGDAGLLLSMCSRLQDLCLMRCSLRAEHLTNHFPDLTEVKLQAIVTDNHSSLTPLLEKFLLRHKATIKKLTLAHIIDFNLGTLEQMTALDELHFELNHPTFSRAANAEPDRLLLKVLGVSCVHGTVSGFLSMLANSPGAANSLEQLTYHGPTDELSLDSLGAFENLVSVSLSAEVTESLRRLNGCRGTLASIDIRLTPDVIGDQLITAISPFRNLRTLNISARGLQNFFASTAAGELRKLDKLTDFSYTGFTSAAVWLQNLGATQTMETIRLQDISSASVQSFPCLYRFRNLKTLEIASNDVRPCIYQLNKIHELSELVELRLDVTKDCNWNRIVELVDRLPKLEKLVLRSVSQRPPFHLNLYRHFVDIYRLRDARKLLIVLSKCDGGGGRYFIPPDILAVYGDLCRFVEIQCTTMDRPAVIVVGATESD